MKVFLQKESKGDALERKEYKKGMTLSFVFWNFNNLLLRLCSHTSQSSVDLLFWRLTYPALGSYIISPTISPPPEDYQISQQQQWDLECNTAPASNFSEKAFWTSILGTAEVSMQWDCKMKMIRAAGNHKSFHTPAWKHLESMLCRNKENKSSHVIKSQDF